MAKRGRTGSALVIALASVVVLGQGGCTQSRVASNASTAEGVATAATVACPADLRALSGMEFERVLGLDAETANDLRQAIAGIADVRFAVQALGDRLSAACGRAAADIGVSVPPGGPNACRALSASVPNAVGEAAAEMRKRAASSLVVGCGLPTQAMSECIGKCVSGHDGVVARVTCESPQRMGACGGACSGVCETQAPAACTGECSGWCSGDFSGRCAGACTGQCDGVEAAGTACAGICVGRCEGEGIGQCANACRGLCRSTAPARCTGTCVGTCSTALEEEACMGWVRAPYAGDACTGRCAAWLAARVECVAAISTGSGPLPPGVSAAAKDAVALAELSEVAPLVAASTMAAWRGLDAALAAGRAIEQKGGEAPRVAAQGAALAKCVAPAIVEAQAAISNANEDAAAVKSLQQSLLGHAQ